MGQERQRYLGKAWPVDGRFGFFQESKIRKNTVRRVVAEDEIMTLINVVPTLATCFTGRVIGNKMGFARNRGS
jgi:hypothetical protein